MEAASEARESLIVELLLARKAFCERSENSSFGPIHLAPRNSHVEVLRLLILKGANVDALTKDGYTALHLAVEDRKRDWARLLLASGARVDSRDALDGDTPLHVTAALGDEYMVKLLLQKGANKDIRNYARRTPYDVAAGKGDHRLFDVLRLGDSLCLAARKGEVRAILQLLENGAAVNGRDQYRWTALHRACFKGRVETVRALLEKGVKVDAKDEDGYTALHCAAESGHGDVIELLVKKGAEVEARTKKGVTATQIAESLHYVGITWRLVHGGASRDDNVNNPSVVSAGYNTTSSLGFGDKNSKVDHFMEGEKGGLLKKKKKRIRGFRV
ncbi:hypothetical protein L484_000326 [Morus notabilis]|uniref:Uncharacterized protein n=1 Tax=Morus notabilis TaxID=981085 RepID=W9SDV9_9ROSA|nr:hypothetical protein L484_000326 [Morus notabilis]